MFRITLMCCIFLTVQVCKISAFINLREPSRECLVDLLDIDGPKSPLVLHKHLDKRAGNLFGQVSLKKDVVFLYCPNETNSLTVENVNRNIAPVLCWDGTLYNFHDPFCQQPVSGTFEVFQDNCGFDYGDAVLYRLGFRLPMGDFLTVMEACWDKTQLHTIFTTHKIQGTLIQKKLENTSNILQDMHVTEINLPSINIGDSYDELFNLHIQSVLFLDTLITPFMNFNKPLVPVIPQFPTVPSIQGNDSSNDDGTTTNPPPSNSNDKDITDNIISAIEEPVEEYSFWHQILSHLGLSSLYKSRSYEIPLTFHQLSPKYDFAFQHERTASLRFINTVPMFPFVRENLINLEQAIRFSAAKSGDTLQMVNGVHEMLEVPNMDSSDKLYLGPNSRISVPKYVWKMVIRERDNAGVVFVLHNSQQPLSRIFCPDVCGFTGVLNLPMAFIQHGFLKRSIQCCTVEDFMKIVPTAPKATVQSLLLHLF